MPLIVPPPESPEPSDQPETGAGPQTLVTVVIDRSGSMEPLRGPVVEGVNQLIAGLEPADRVTIVQFDSEDPYDVLVDAVPAAEVTPIPYDRYAPRGGTPLFDAVGTAIARTAGQAREVEILTGTPPTVVLAIVTDGYENASTDYDGPQVARLIAHSRDEGWTITYVGIGLGDDAFTQAQNMGIDVSYTMSVDSTGDGTRAAFSSISRATEDSRARRRPATPDPS